VIAWPVWCTGGGWCDWGESWGFQGGKDEVRPPGRVNEARPRYPDTCAILDSYSERCTWYQRMYFVRSLCSVCKNVVKRCIDYL
jgi:hypothetical protein